MYNNYKKSYNYNVNMTLWMPVRDTVYEGWNEPITPEGWGLLMLIQLKFSIIYFVLIVFLTFCLKS